MEPDEARAALDDVYRRQRQSRAAYLQYGFSRSRLLVSALLLFASFASFDLPNPWGGAVLFPVSALLACQLVACLRRAPVRMPLGKRQALLSAASGAALAGSFTVLSDAAQAGGVPAPHTVTAAVLCAAGLAAVSRARGATGTPARRADGQGGGAGGQ